MNVNTLYEANENEESRLEAKEFENGIVCWIVQEQVRFERAIFCDQWMNVQDVGRSNMFVNLLSRWRPFQVTALPSMWSWSTANSRSETRSSSRDRKAQSSLRFGRCWCRSPCMSFVSRWVTSCWSGDVELENYWGILVRLLYITGHRGRIQLPLKRFPDPVSLP